MTEMTGLAGRKDRQIEAIRWLRGVAAFAVMLSHLMVIEGKYGGGRILPDWFLGGFAGVDLFFAISGFVMVWVTWQMAPGMRNTARFLWSRVTRIYPAYWVVSLALLPVWILAPQMVMSSLHADPVLWRSFLLFPDARPPLLPVGWTLVHEMYFYLVFAVLILLMPARWRLLGVLVWIGVVLLLAWRFWPLTHVTPLLSVLASPLSLEFVAGTLAAWAFLRWQGKGALPAMVLGLLYMLVALIWLLRTHGEAGFAMAFRGFLFAPGLLALLYGLVGLERQGLRLWGLFGRVGDQSYSLYLTHLLSLSALGRIWAMFTRPGIWDNLIMLPVLVAGALLVGWLCWRWIELPVQKWSHARRQVWFV